MIAETLDRVGLEGASVSLTIAEGRIAAIRPCPEPATRQAIPLFVDPHVHLDKNYILARAGRGAPGLFGAIAATAEDVVNWTPGDIRSRAARGLAEAYAYGVVAMRTHVDWYAPQPPVAWDVLGDLAREWAGRIDLQRAALCLTDVLGDPDHGPGIARTVARSENAVLGAFVYRNDDLGTKLARIFALAADHGLALDFHVDEGLEQEAQGLDEIVRLTRAHGMAGRVLCGHACSLAIRPVAEVARVLDAAAEAGVGLTVQPVTNTWLQDSIPGRTPRMRGIAPVQEARASGVDVMFGADNVSDPFHPFGCYDPVEVFRSACLSASLDPREWLDAITTIPARWLGRPVPTLVEGAAADFVLLEGTDWYDALRRPGPRIVYRDGRAT